MKSFLALSLSLVPLLVSPAVLAAPTPDPEPLPAGFQHITREEILRRINTSPADPAEGLLKRTPGNVFMCTGSNWSNTCAVVTFSLDGSCKKLPEPYFKSVGSIGPDPGALCRLTTSSSTGCTAHGDLFLQSPGFSDLYNHDGVDYGHSAQFMDREGTISAFP
ncbi:hypothetical protein VTK73DRAFT_9539 [Phialemonium thermophilum]|uniref:Uncharacterized protein n=1 Tax=Phialemonium thermophilum TaxID=223376 RepID=A0ABR3XKV7_9PEZI